MAASTSTPLVRNPGNTETVYVDMQCHLVVRDPDTGEKLLDQRG